MVRYLHKETGLDNLCMAGGVALNCVANGRVIRETPIKNLFVQPAAGDAGGAVGVAHYLYNTHREAAPRAGLDPCLPRPRVQRRRRSSAYLDGRGRQVPRAVARGARSSEPRSASPRDT